MTRVDIENAGRIEREKVIKELQDGYNKHHDINHYTIATSTVDKYALPLFMVGVEWFRKSLFHKTKNEVPQEIYSWFKEILFQSDCTPNFESVTQRKKFKSLTAKGLEFGENQVSPNNPKETQPLYYVGKFDELLNAIAS